MVPRENRTAKEKRLWKNIPTLSASAAGKPGDFLRHFAASSAYEEVAKTVLPTALQMTEENPSDSGKLKPSPAALRCLSHLSCNPHHREHHSPPTSGSRNSISAATGAAEGHPEAAQERRRRPEAALTALSYATDICVKLRLSDNFVVNSLDEVKHSETTMEVRKEKVI